MGKFLWLDDWRNPEHHAPETEHEIFWAKNQAQFDAFLEENGMPDEVSLDYDLNDGRGDGGFWTAKAIARLAAKQGIPFPKWHVHSEHPDKDKLIRAMEAWEMQNEWRLEEKNTQES